MAFLTRAEFEERINKNKTLHFKMSTLRYTEKELLLLRKILVKRFEESILNFEKRSNDLFRIPLTSGSMLHSLYVRSSSHERSSIGYNSTLDKECSDKYYERSLMENWVVNLTETKSKYEDIWS